MLVVAAANRALAVAAVVANFVEGSYRIADDTQGERPGHQMHQEGMLQTLMAFEEWEEEIAVMQFYQCMLAIGNIAEGHRGGWEERLEYRTSLAQHLPVHRHRGSPELEHAEQHFPLGFGRVPDGIHY